MMLKTFVLWIFLSCSLLVNDALRANSSKSPDSEVVSPSTYKQLKTVESHVEKSQYGKALGVLEQLLPAIDDIAFEKAVVLESIASVYTMQGRYEKAADAMNQCIDTHALPENRKQRALIKLAQIYIKLERYKLAAQIMEPWITAAEKIDANDYILMAQVFTHLKHFRKALSYTKKAVAATNNPKESWYQLMLALNYELGNLPATTVILKHLIRKHPKKQYWEQLTSVYQQMKKFNKAVSVKELAYQSGYLTTPKEIIELTKLFLYIDAPYKAARILEKEINQNNIKQTSTNYELLANAWTQAKEFQKATMALEHAARLSNKGELYVRLGRLYIEEENWSKAHTALLDGFKKGQINDLGNAYVLLGIISHELQLRTQAENSFTKAKQYKKTQKTAEEWLAYLHLEGL